MADLFVPIELRIYLIAQGVGQLPSAAPSQTLPSIHVDPQDGAPLPRAGEAGTVSLIDTALRSPSSLEPWMEETYVDVIVRHRSPSTCRLIHRSIRGLLIGPSDVGGKKLWTMGSLLVETSTDWRPEQPLPFADDGDTDVASRVASYRFCCRRKALQGQPYVP